MSVDLLAERMNRGVSIAQVARETGVARATLRRIEREPDYVPRAPTAKRIAEWLKREPADLWPTTRRAA